MEVMLTAAAIRHAMLLSKCHHQQTNTQFFTSRIPFHRPTNIVKALKGKVKSLNVTLNTAVGVVNEKRSGPV